MLADGVVVGRIFKADAAPVGMPWMWTMLFDLPLADARLRANTRGRDGGVREKFVTEQGVNPEATLLFSLTEWAAPSQTADARGDRSEGPR